MQYQSAIGTKDPEAIESGCVNLPDHLAGAYWGVTLIDLTPRLAAKQLYGT